MTLISLEVDRITVEGRARREMRGIDSLAASIAEVGLLHPVVVTSKYTLIAGGRRLAAVKALGWVTVPTHVVENLTDVADLLKAESDENTEREPLTPTEAETLATAIEAALKPAAEAREKAGRPSADSAQGPALKSRVIAARAVGLSHDSVSKVRKTKAIAESPETPDRVRAVAVKALADMDLADKIDASSGVIQSAESPQESQRTPSLPHTRQRSDPRNYADRGASRHSPTLRDTPRKVRDVLRGLIPGGPHAHTSGVRGQQLTEPQAAVAAWGSVYPWTYADSHRP